MGNTESRSARSLWAQVRAKQGLQYLGAAGATALVSPVAVIAIPILGAYQYGVNQEFTGYSCVDGQWAGLLGVVKSPLAPFYFFLKSMRKMFKDRSDEGLVLTQEYVDRANHILDLDFNCHNIAIVGSPGTGKSSLVNGLLGYKNGDVNAAPTGEVQSTMAPKKYIYPNMESIMVWDFPGMGTPSHPSKGFFDRYCLGAFDVIIIVFSDRLMASDIHTARMAMKYDKPVLFVRNQSDRAIKEKIKRKDHHQDEIEAWAYGVSTLTLEVQKRVLKIMKHYKLDPNRLYLLSAPTLQDLMSESPQKDIKLIHEKIFIEHVFNLLL
ncbi:interferon-inducible GTPase-domain-containing protein [Pilobolus umbonatus]|nr:interferon-inducible GTPase-domain-containing protein [Pilobolus umbonatus]